MPDTTLESPSRRRCPQCGSRVKRVLRTANDKRLWDAADWRRYRCRSDTCTWHGLLQVSTRRRPRLPQEAGPSAVLRMGRVALLLLLAAGVAWGGMMALQYMLGP